MMIGDYISSAAISQSSGSLFSIDSRGSLDDAARVLGLMDSARIVCSPSCLYYGNRRRIIDRDRRYSGRSCFSPGSFKSAASGCMLRDDNRLTLDVRFDEHSSIYWKRSAPRSRLRRKRMIENYSTIDRFVHPSSFTSD